MLHLVSVLESLSFRVLYSLFNYGSMYIGSRKTSRQLHSLVLSFYELEEMLSVVLSVFYFSFPLLSCLKGGRGFV